jgi:hypothetical protein
MQGESCVRQQGLAANGKIEILGLQDYVAHAGTVLPAVD